MLDGVYEVGVASVTGLVTVSKSVIETLAFGAELDGRCGDSNIGAGAMGSTSVSESVSGGSRINGDAVHVDG